MEKNRNRDEIITTAEGRELVPLDDYIFPSDESEFVGILRYRTWHPKSQVPCLWCCFDADDGQKYKLSAWWDKNYCPVKSNISFADDVQNGTKWRCTSTKTKKGYATWITAEAIE